jgi:hypothetical protein
VPDDGPPDLHEFIRRFGGYAKVTPEGWAEWDLLNAQYQARHRKIDPDEKAFLASLPKPPPSPFQVCASCSAEAHFGYKDAETGQLVWFCELHRLGKWWADARR